MHFDRVRAGADYLTAEGRTLRALLLCLVVTACGGGGDDSTVKQANASAGNSLMEVTAAPAGSACANGGQKLAFGADLDADGVLQPAEITGVNYACSSNGANALVTASQAVNAGNATCPNGGTQVVSGLNSDGSGALLNADGSINIKNATKITYVCSGLPGASSTASTALLVSSSVVPAGNLDCPAGCTAVIMGRNTDGTGLLRNADGSINAANVLNVTYVSSANADPVLVNVTGAAQQMISNVGYIAASDTAQVVLTLPAAPQAGDVVRVQGSGLGGWRVAQNDGQSIDLQGLSMQPLPAHTLSSSTTPGTSGGLTGGAGDSVALVYLGDGKFAVQSYTGSGFVAYDAASNIPPNPPDNSASSPSGSGGSQSNAPSFTFGNLTRTFGDVPFQISPPSQGGTFSYAVSNSNSPASPVAQISGSTVTIDGAGVAS